MSKLCNDCGIIPLRYNNRSGYCRGCYERNRPRAKKGSPEWVTTQQAARERYQKNPDRERARARTWRFGITKEQYDAMRFKQNYMCAICDRPESQVGTLHVDHDHSCCPTSRGERTCGKCIRALLCRECNKGLGNFQDNIDRLNRATAYIKEHR